MKNPLTQRKKEKAIFICQLSENSLEILKCAINRNFKKEFVAAHSEAVTADSDEKKLTEKFSQLLNKLNYNNQLLIASLPRNQVTTRYLKVPTQLPQEIEKIITLQASRYLPYPASELITGYQIIATDKNGYTYVNVVIAHKDVIERYTKIFKELKITQFNIVLSSIGLCNLYNSLESRSASFEAMLVDISGQQVELAVISGKKLIFSRYFKLDRAQPGWENLFAEEIRKSQDAYEKEISKVAPLKMVLVGAENQFPALQKILGLQSNLKVETQPLENKINISTSARGEILNSGHSFVSLIGLGLEEIPASLSLLPQTIKESFKEFYQRRENLRLTVMVAGIILILGLAVAKDLDNKDKYLQRLKQELSKISKEAKVLEDIEKRLKLLETRAVKKPTSLDILVELHQIIPEQISLSNFNYEEDNQIVLRGQAAMRSYVLDLVGQLEKSTVFKGFNIKPRYATTKNTPQGEVVDFEIACSKK